MHYNSLNTCNLYSQPSLASVSSLFSFCRSFVKDKKSLYILSNNVCVADTSDFFNNASSSIFLTHSGILYSLRVSHLLILCRRLLLPILQSPYFALSFSVFLTIALRYFYSPLQLQFRLFFSVVVIGTHCGMISNYLAASHHFMLTGFTGQSFIALRAIIVHSSNLLRVLSVTTFPLKLKPHICIVMGNKETAITKFS